MIDPRTDPRATRLFRAEALERFYGRPAGAAELARTPRWLQGGLVAVLVATCSLILAAWLLRVDDYASGRFVVETNAPSGGHSELVIELPSSSHAPPAATAVTLYPGDVDHEIEGVFLATEVQTRPDSARLIVRGRLVVVPNGTPEGGATGDVRIVLGSHSALASLFASLGPRAR